MSSAPIIILLLIALSLTQMLAPVSEQPAGEPIAPIDAEW
jgi:hypothetical protein